LAAVAGFAATGVETVFNFGPGGTLETGFAATVAAGLPVTPGLTAPALGPAVVLETGLAVGVGLDVGFVAAFDVACAGAEVCAAPAAGLAAKGEVAELGGAAGLVFCAGLGAAGAVEAEPLGGAETGAAAGLAGAD
jgi:hypothetical protein